MKTIKLALGAFAVLALSAFTVVQSSDWKLNEQSYSVTFKGGDLEGTFKGLKTAILFDEAVPEKAKISASINVNTINTGNGMKNKHAKGADALNAKQFPEITFVSESVNKKGTSYTALGKLTMRGVTKALSLPFTFTNKGVEGIFSGKLTVNTKEYGITKMHVPEIIEINIVASVTK